MKHSTKSAQAEKPVKPHPDFPLFPHATKRWAKKVRGKLHYFGPWDDPQAAIEKWLAVKDDLLAGRTPRLTDGELTVKDLCNHFLTSKQGALDCGEIVNRTFIDYRRTTDRLIAVFGKGRAVVDLAADDFERLKADIASSGGPVYLGNEITRARVVFKYAYDAGLIDRPVRFGPAFRKPGKRIIRKARNGGGSRMFEAAEIRKLLEAAPTAQMRAMILLGINGGLGNADVGTLPQSAMDLDGGWLSYARIKTGVDRRIPLWPETVKAMREAITERPDAKDEADADLVFLTRCRERWHKDTNAAPLSREFRKLTEAVGVYRKGVAFYGLRHSFRTVADESRDFPAIDMIMGHSDQSMAAHYRERISDDRLRAVVDHVRAWLFG